MFFLLFYFADCGIIISGIIDERRLFDGLYQCITGGGKMGLVREKYPELLPAGQDHLCSSERSFVAHSGKCRKA